MAENEKTNPEVETAASGPAAEPAEKPKGKKAKAAKAGDLEARLASAEQKAADAEQAAEDTRQTRLRTVAEDDNDRKGSQKENEGAFNNGVAFAAEQLLPVLDTLEADANAPTTEEEYKKGVVMTLAKATEVFGKLGISEIEAQDQPFDPELHNAVMQEPCDGKDSCTVTRVMQKGYTLNGRVIRHAMVAVTP